MSENINLKIKDTPPLSENIEKTLKNVIVTPTLIAVWKDRMQKHRR